MDDKLAVFLIMLCLLLTVFGIFYLRNRENMALIERGFNPRNTERPVRLTGSLKYGLMLLGAGAGLVLAYGICLPLEQSGYLNYRTQSGFQMEREVAPLYFGLTALGGGLGLLQAYRMARKRLGQKTDLPREEQ